jgi:hypothetical protein
LGDGFSHHPAQGVRRIGRCRGEVRIDLTRRRPRPGDHFGARPGGTGISHPKDAWRNATPSWSHHASSGDYLRWLAANDYPLASVEEVITEAKDAESVYAQHLSDAVKE